MSKTVFDLKNSLKIYMFLNFLFSFDFKQAKEQTLFMVQPLKII